MADQTPERQYGPQYKLIGKNYVTADLIAKVTGKSKYAEDFRAEGMLFCKLLLSPLPHARVKRIDASNALALPGVRAILTADDLPAPADTLTDNGTVIKASKWGERGLTMEPVYQGEPILAVAAVDELTAAEAVESIHIDFERLPFVVDPLDTLRPGGPNPRTDGNIWATPPGGQAPAVSELKWTAADFAEITAGHLPMGKTPDEWSYGDLDAGFKNAALVLDETFVTPDVSHQTLETRSAMAYWQNGKVYLHTGTQSTVQTRLAVARWLNMDLDKIVFISEYTGGGFGSKGTGVSMIIPALLSKKANAPVMMRISREEETFIGRARPGFQGRMKVGFSKEGRVLAVDMFVISDNGPYDAQGDAPTSGHMVSLLYQPQAMRWRGVTVLTNTPPRSAQSSPGGLQGISIIEPIIAKAARKLGVDQVAIRHINCPEGKAPYGPPVQGKLQHATSAFLKQALQSGAEQFQWREKVARSPKRIGSKVRGVGVSLSCYVGGTIGFDGLLVITPEGRVRFQSGIGNLGTESVIDVHRVGAEVASFWLDFWAIWPDRADLTDAWRRVRKFMGRPAQPPRRFAKYPLENKLYHGAIIAAGLSAIGTGVFMMSRVRTIFFPRNPYLFSDMTWGLMYVLHGLAGVGLIALVTVHVYFAVRPEKLDITKSMIFGSMRREFYMSHYDPQRWTVEVPRPGVKRIKEEA